MKGPTESKNSPLLGENGGQEPCIPQVPLQDITDLRNLSSAGCRRDDRAFCPRGSVRFRAGNHVHDFKRASAPSELCERPPCSSSTPCGAVWRVSCCGHAVRSLYRGTLIIGALILSTSDGETGPVATSCPFPDS